MLFKLKVKREGWVLTKIRLQNSRQGILHPLVLVHHSPSIEQTDMIGLDY
jgi:hypothetical protein